MRFLEVETGFPTPPSSATDRLPRSRWWTQSQSLLFSGKELTQQEKSATLKPSLLGCLTAFVVSIIVFFPILRCNVSFSVESISFSPSSAAWHVDFLVKYPSSRCAIYYDGDDVYAKLGPVNAAVLKTSHTRSSGGYTRFSVDLATENNQSDVVSASPRVFELDIKLSAKNTKNLYGNEIASGHFDVRCENLITDHLYNNDNSISIPKYSKYVLYLDKSTSRRFKIRIQVIPSHRLIFPSNDPIILPAGSAVKFTGISPQNTNKNPFPYSMPVFTPAIISTRISQITSPITSGIATTVSKTTFVSSPVTTCPKGSIDGDDDLAITSSPRSKRDLIGRKEILQPVTGLLATKPILHSAAETLAFAFAFETDTVSAKSSK
ncbi:unnamed protein product [Thlaspi arvense]|uniref:Uncharacterized protein n=1 Tax=Thlaspi arvense TaxID=13288 RepID=A0AAU9SX78_THLAR|nr:unnamed protein product [Thlaspi arvense]